MRILTLTFLLTSFTQIKALSLCSDPSIDKLSICKNVENYDKSFPGDPIKVYNSVTVLDIVEFNADDNTITLFVQIMVMWNDTRLTLTTGDATDDLKNRWLYLDQSKANELFFPKMKVLNAKSVTRHKGYGPTDSHYFWFQYPHHLEYKETMKATVYCSFDFGSFPFDEHICNFNFGASDNADYNTVLLPTEVLHGDLKTKLGDTDHVSIAEPRVPFTIGMKSMEPFSILDAGYNYSMAGMKIEFDRNGLGLLLGGYFSPTALFAFLSTISFHINPEVVPGRMGLLVTLYLISANVYNSVKAPVSRGFSHIEVWNIGVQVPILFAILEYGFVLATLKYAKKDDDAKVEKFDGPKKMDLKKLLKMMDLTSFFISLTFIILFNAIFWPVLLA